MPKTTIAGQPPQRIIKHVSWFAKKIHQVITSQHSGRPERIVRVSKNEVHDNHPRQTLGYTVFTSPDISTSGRRWYGQTKTQSVQRSGGWGGISSPELVWTDMTCLTHQGFIRLDLPVLKPQRLRRQGSKETPRQVVRPLQAKSSDSGHLVLCPVSRKMGVPGFIHIFRPCYSWLVVSSINFIFHNI